MLQRSVTRERGRVSLGRAVAEPVHGAEVLDQIPKFVQVCGGCRGSGPPPPDALGACGVLTQRYSRRLKCTPRLTYVTGERVW